MVDGLIRNQEGGAAQRLSIAVCCLLFTAYGYAEDLPDPTRPPAMISTPDFTVGQGVVDNRPPSGLHTIIISESRRAAIIDGQTVELGARLGARHGNAKLIEVNEGNVVLQSAQGRKVLTLFPDVKMTTARMTGLKAHKEKK